MSMKNMTKENNDACVSILRHSRAMTRESRNKDIMPLDSRIKYENDNVDTMPLDTRVKHEYDKAERVFENDNSVSSSCHSGLRAGIQRDDNLMPKAFRFAQSGRSMVEMLGVLAVIGVLSIGALSAIRYILDKNTANDIMKEALTQASEIKIRRRQKVHSSGEVKYAYGSEYIKSRTYSENGLELILKTKNNISEAVCKKLISEEPVSIFDSITTTTGECKTYNTIVFTTDTTSLPTQGEFDACKNENCCGHGTCNPDTGYCECNDGWMGDRCCEQNCPLPDRVQTCLSLDNEFDENGCISKQYYKVPCQEEFNEYCDANGECQECGTNMVLNSDKNGCVCKENMVLNSSGSGCECSTGEEWVEGANMCLPKCEGSGMTGERDSETYSCKCLAGTNAETCACPAGYAKWLFRFAYNRIPN